MSSVNFPDSPTNGQTFISGGAYYTYNTSKGYWDGTSILPAGGDISVYTTLANMPLSGVDEGTLAKVLDTNKLYKWTGTGWYYLDPVNTNPSITTGGDSSYTLAGDGTPTVVTLEANDPEGFAIIWSYAVTTGSLGSTATVTQADNVFTITPSTDSANAGGFTLTFTASDGVNLDTSASQFSLSFASWSAATLQATLIASDIQTNDRFGTAVSISSDGNTAIAGAYLEDTGAADSGAAYIFTRSGSTWTEQAKIQSSDIQAGDSFGSAVSISGDGNTAIVGAWQEDTGGDRAGSAYIFTRSGSTWTEQAKIQSSDIQAGDRFGNEVALSDDGNTAIVGAFLEDTTATDAGSAYIFTRSGSTWTEQAKIQASDAATTDRFGREVSISGDGNTVIAAADNDDDSGESTGSAYVFTRSGSTWSQQAKLLASDAAASSNFGFSASLSSDGNTAIVGAYLDDTAGTDAGAAYIFTRSGSTWTQQTKIQASDAATIDRAGNSVSMSSDGNTAIVGAYEEGYSTSDSNRGAVYIYTRSGSTWTEQVILNGPNSGDYDYGNSVSISGDGTTAIVGSPLDGTGGLAYVYTQG